MSLIYKHTFKTTGKSYIGKTSKTVLERLDTHINNALTKQLQTHFCRAIRKYGKDDINTEILEENISDLNVNSREIYWISFFDTFNNGYNMTIGGDGGNTRAKMNNKQIKIYNKKLSIASKKMIFTDEHKKKISDAKSENPTKLFGDKNGRALEIVIYNDKSEVMFESNGNFKDICEQNNLPYASLNNSRYNNSEMKRGKYKGWYARLK